MFMLAYLRYVTHTHTEHVLYLGASNGGRLPGALRTIYVYKNVGTCTRWPCNTNDKRFCI